MPCRLSLIEKKPRQVMESTPENTLYLKWGAGGRRMSFYKKYELIDVLRDDGVKTFQAKEIESGRLLEVHLIVGIPGKSDPPYSVLEAIRTIPPERRTLLVETGEHMGTPYVVTLPLSGATLRDWVQANKGEPGGTPETLARVGRWKIPASIRDSGAAEPPVPPVTKRQNIPQPDTPDITRMFKTAEIVVPPKEDPKPWATGQLPAATPSMPPASASHDDFDILFQSATTPTSTAQHKAPVPPPAPAQPGDFTQMFQTGNLKTPQPPPAFAPQSAPGEFTSMFQSPAKPPQAAEPDDFNRMFDTVTGRIKPPDPPKQPEPKVSAPAAPPTATGPGEFTSMFQAPPAAPPLPKTVQSRDTAPPASGPGEFTQMFHAPSSPPAAAAPPKPEVSRTAQMPAFTPPAAAAPAPPSEFTQMFQASTAQLKPSDLPSMPPAPPAAAASTTGEFTQMFQAPAAAKLPEPPKTAPVKPATAPAAPPPGDFTQMFQATGQMKPPDPPAAAGPSHPPAAQSPGEFTQMFRTSPGQPAFEPAKPAAKPAPPPPAPPPPAGAPGEFTQMFQTAPHQPFGEPPARPSTQRGTPPGVTPPAPPPPGEFTRMFASPTKPIGENPSFGTPPPPAPPPHQEAGEFTRMFSSPSAGSFPKQQLPVAAPQQSPLSQPNPFAPPTSPLPQSMIPPNPGGASPFAQSGTPFGAPPPGPPSSPFGPTPPAQPGVGAIPQRPYAAPAQPSVQDEYAKLFGGGAPTARTDQFQQPPTPAPPQPFQGGGFSSATQSFQSPQMGAPSVPQQAGPSEYTRMFSAPKDLQAPAAPSAVPQPIPIAAAKKSPKWPLFVAGGIFLLLLIGLVVTLIRK